MNGYDLARDWFNFRYGKKNDVKPIHSELYFYIVDLWNRLGQPKEFGLPTDASMNALGIGSYNTYKKSLEMLMKWKFVREVSSSKNQYQSRVIALSKYDKSLDKSLDKALIKALDNPIDESLDETVDSIILVSKDTNKNKEQGTTNKEQRKRESRFKPPSLEDVEQYILEKKYLSVNAKSFWNFYESKNWYVGKNKMKDWKKAVAGWESRNNEKSNSNGKAGQNTNNRQYEASDNLKRKIFDGLQSG